MTDQTPETLGSDPLLLVGKSEEDLYVIALSEVNSNSRRPGLWAKALSDSLGDEKKSEALYLRYRKEQLQGEQERQQQSADESHRSKVVSFNCPSCGTERKKVTQGMIDDLLSATSPDWVFRCSDCNQTFDLRDVLPALREANPPPSSPANRLAQSKTEKKGLAIASLICGIIGGWASTASIPAVICGHLSLSKIKKNPKVYGGKGMAIAGLVLGYVSLILAVILGTMRGIFRVQLHNMGY